MEPGQILLSACLPACLPSFPFFLPALLPLPPSGTACPHVTQGQAGPHALDCLPVQASLSLCVRVTSFRPELGGLVGMPTLSQHPVSTHTHRLPGAPLSRPRMVPLRSGLSRLSVKRVSCKEFLPAPRAFAACLAVLLGSNGELACVAAKASFIEMGRRRPLLLTLGLD